MSYIVTDGANRGIRASGDKSHKFTNEETFLWLNERRRDTRAGSARPHRRCPIIGSPPPEKSQRPTIYWQKIRPPAGRTFTDKLSAGEDFSGGGDPIMVAFMGPAIF